MTLNVVSPDLQTDNASDEQIAAALRLLYDQRADAVILVADKKNKIFMQMGCGGGHIEYCVGPEGSIYSADEIPLDLAIQMFLAYNSGEKSWLTAVPWKVEIEKL